MSTNEESKKRGFSHQDDIGAAIRNKRAALNPSREATDHDNSQSQSKFSRSSSSSSEKHIFKILCPQSITGIIIGRGGSTINQLNGSTGCGIKLSHNNEYYPGTNDRILLLNGTPEALQLAIDALTTKIAEAAEKKYPTEPRLDPFPPNRSADGQFLVRVLIPRSSEGAMIGKGGVVVRQMTAETGCNFQLGNENDQYATNERIFILTSPSVQGVVLGVNAVMHTLITSPKIRGYVNTGTAYGQAPSNQAGAPVPHAAPYNNNTNGYAPAPVLTAPGMVPYAQAPAPTVMYAPAPVVVGMPPQQLQYVQVPPQMAVPVAVQQVGGYPQVQMPFQQPQGGNYQYNQGQYQAQGQGQGQQGQGQGQGREPVRHAGGPNGRGSHGGAGGSTQGQSQQPPQQQQGGYNKYGGNNNNNNQQSTGHSRYQQGAPAAGHQQQQPVYTQQQAPVAYQQQQPLQQQAQVMPAGQYPVQGQPHQQGQVQGQQQQYLYPAQPMQGMPQQQQQGKMPHQPQPQAQQQAYGAPPMYQQQVQPQQYAMYPAAAYAAADPSQPQQHQHQQPPQQQMHLQYAVPVQQGAPQMYAPQPQQQQQQQQYVQYGQQPHQQQQPAAGATGASQQYVYGAPAARK